MGEQGGTHGRHTEVEIIVVPYTGETERDMKKGETRNRIETGKGG